ncbi:MAG: FixH family protein [Betaproteobacteria bacterium]|nr:FixH family protein [Betaproteobacteria bacterium]
MNAPAVKPWYREPWPWILMAGPALVIVAGVVTAWLAVSTSDGLVAEDYYKQGLAAKQTIARSESARRMGLTAALRLTSESVAVKLSATAPDFAPPPVLRLTLSHPTRAGLDQTEVLTREGDGYIGALRLPASGHWLVLLEDEAKSWRLLGNVVLPAAGAIEIGGDSPADIRNQ